MCNVISTIVAVFHVGIMSVLLFAPYWCFEKETLEFYVLSLLHVPELQFAFTSSLPSSIYNCKQPSVLLDIFKEMSPPVTTCACVWRSCSCQHSDWVHSSAPARVRFGAVTEVAINIFFFRQTGRCSAKGHDMSSQKTERCVRALYVIYFPDVFEDIGWFLNLRLEELGCFI